MKLLVRGLSFLDQPLKLKSISVEMKGMAWQGTRSFLKEVRKSMMSLRSRGWAFVAVKGKSVPTNRTLQNVAFSLHVLQGLFGVSGVTAKLLATCGSHCSTIVGVSGLYTERIVSHASYIEWVF